MVYLKLLYEFLKTGLFAIGGGLATLPFLSQMADKYPEWFTHEMLADMIAISEATPGPIGINMATYAGYNAGGVLGSLVATFAVSMPAFVIILIIARFLTRFKESQLVQGAFYGLRPAVAGLIAAAGWQVLQLSVLSVENASWASFDLRFAVPGAIMFAIILPLSLKLKKIHPAFYILAAGILGVILKL